MKLSIVKHDRQKIYNNLPKMSNQQRIKLYKKLWFQRHKYTKRGEQSKADYYDRIMDRVRIYKKHSIAYRKMIHKHLHANSLKQSHLYRQRHHSQIKIRQNRYYHNHLDKCRLKDRERAHKFYTNHTKLCRLRSYDYYNQHRDAYLRYAHNRYHNQVKDIQK